MIKLLFLSNCRQICKSVCILIYMSSICFDHASKWTSKGNDLMLHFRGGMSLIWWNKSGKTFWSNSTDSLRYWGCNCTDDIWYARVLWYPLRKCISHLSQLLQLCLITLKKESRWHWVLIPKSIVINEQTKLRCFRVCFHWQTCARGGNIWCCWIGLRATGSLKHPDCSYWNEAWWSSDCTNKDQQIRFASDNSSNLESTGFSWLLLT